MDEEQNTQLAREERDHERRRVQDEIASMERANDTQWRKDAEEKARRKAKDKGEQETKHDTTNGQPPALPRPEYSEEHGAIGRVDGEIRLFPGMQNGSPGRYNQFRDGK